MCLVDYVNYLLIFFFSTAYFDIQHVLGHFLISCLKANSVNSSFFNKLQKCSCFKGFNGCARWSKTRLGCGLVGRARWTWTRLGCGLVSRKRRSRERLKSGWDCSCRWITGLAAICTGIGSILATRALGITIVRNVTGAARKFTRGSLGVNNNVIRIQSGCIYF